MPSEDLAAIVRDCTRFLSDHPPRTVRQRLEDIAESPLALTRNDHYGRGGVVADLEVQVAELLGKEAAVFMPSGTMAQPIALRIWADEAGVRTVAFHPTCHLELHEHMAYRELHGLEAVLLGAPDRLFDANDLRQVEKPLSTVLIELPQREIGGQLPTWEELTQIVEVAKSQKARLHLDGARLWECAPYYGRSYKEICAPFDSVYVSFYKILFGLPGAILAGPEGFIDKARVWQRRQGGNLQQQSPAAISAKLGLERVLPRVPLYVAKATEIAEALSRLEGVRVVPERPPTNMMHLYLAGDPERLSEAALEIAREEKVWLFYGLGPNGKFEIAVGEGALALSSEEIARLFRRLLTRAKG